MGGGEFAAEEELFHLLGEEFARRGVRQHEPVFVDQTGLVSQPFLPGLLRNLLENALAERARNRRLGQAFGFFAELDAIDGTGHGYLGDDEVDARRFRGLGPAARSNAG